MPNAIALNQELHIKTEDKSQDSAWNDKGYLNISGLNKKQSSSNQNSSRRFMSWLLLFYEYLTFLNQSQGGFAKKKIRLSMRCWHIYFRTCKKTLHHCTPARCESSAVRATFQARYTLCYVISPSMSNPAINEWMNEWTLTLLPSRCPLSAYLFLLVHIDLQSGLYYLRVLSSIARIVLEIENRDPWEGQRAVIIPRGSILKVMPRRKNNNQVKSITFTRQQNTFNFFVMWPNQQFSRHNHLLCLIVLIHIWWQLLRIFSPIPTCMKGAS